MQRAYDQSNNSHSPDPEAHWSSRFLDSSLSGMPATRLEYSRDLRLTVVAEIAPGRRGYVAVLSPTDSRTPGVGGSRTRATARVWIRAHGGCDGDVFGKMESREQQSWIQDVKCSGEMRGDDVLSLAIPRSERDSLSERMAFLSAECRHACLPALIHTLPLVWTESVRLKGLAILKTC